MTKNNKINLVGDLSKDNFKQAEKEAEALELNGEFDENAELKAYEEEKIKKIIEETKSQIGEVYKKQEILSRNLIKRLFWGSESDLDLAEKLANIREETGKELKNIQQMFVLKMKQATKSEKAFDQAFDEILLYATSTFLDKEMHIQEEKEKNYVYTDNATN